MSAPTLDALRDIHLPPQPVLATVLPLILLLAALAATFWLARRWLNRRPLRSALRELAGLAAAHARDADTNQLVRGLSGLVRRYAIGRFSQVGVAGLSGRAWLDFLDVHGGGGAFSKGVGAALEARPYQARGAVDEAALMALVRRWLQANSP